MRFLALIVSLSSPAFAGDIYDCAKELAYLHTGVRPLGPIFALDGFVFTSIDGPRSLFVVLTNREILAAPLENKGLRHMAFRLNRDVYFLGYAHDDLIGNRYFEYGVNAIPPGRIREDYQWVDLKLTPSARPAVVSLMDEQLGQILAGMRAGAIDKSRASIFPLNACERLSGDIHAAQLRHNVDVLHVWVPQSVSKRRSPASL